MRASFRLNLKVPSPILAKLGTLIRYAEISEILVETLAICFVLLEIGLEALKIVNRRDIATFRFYFGARPLRNYFRRSLYSKK